MVVGGGGGTLCLCVCVCVFARVLISLVPRPCEFVACSTKFVQRAWARSSCDGCRSLRNDPSTRISDVIDELAPCLPLKEAPKITV